MTSFWDVTFNGLNMKQNLNDPALQQLSERIARAAIAVHEQQTSQEARSVRVVMAGKMITVTLTGILSPAEQAMARTPAGATKVQDFHRELSLHWSDALCSQIQQIVRLEVQEVRADADPTSGTFVPASTAGKRVQLFLLSDSLAAETFDDIGESGLAPVTDATPRSAAA
jgi:uncharacterized protein YbcI